MRTHDLAKALNYLGRILRAGPNVELDQLVNLDTYVARKVPRKTKAGPDRGAGLVLLSEMSNYSKRELLELASSLDIPIEVRPADAVRDVLGKMLKYIAENPEVKERLARAGSSGREPKVSSLARALEILLSQP